MPNVGDKANLRRYLTVRNRMKSQKKENSILSMQTTLHWADGGRGLAGVRAAQIS